VSRGLSNTAMLGDGEKISQMAKFHEGPRSSIPQKHSIDFQIVFLLLRVIRLP
jgi:hypothetical protein